MTARQRLVLIVLAVAGVLAAAGIGVAANAISGSTIGLSAEPLRAGDRLAPAATDDRGHGTGGGDDATTTSTGRGDDARTTSTGSGSAGGDDRGSGGSGSDDRGGAGGSGMGSTCFSRDRRRARTARAFSAVRYATP